jgi:Protein of unknown function (DUF4054)
VGTGPITFVYSDWIAQFPAFVNVSSGLATTCFNFATGLCDNTACSPVCNSTILTQLLYLLTAHICWLTAPQINGLPNDTGGGDLSPQPVGRLAAAGEGSTSATFEMAGVAANAQWYMQTQYGAMYWALSSPYRMARYVPGPRTIPSGQLGNLYGGLSYRRLR